MASTLGKLNSSIAALQKSLGALTGSVNKQAAQQAALAPSKSQFMPPIAVNGLGIKKKVKSFSQRISDEISKALKRTLATNKWNDPNIGPIAKEWNIDSIWTRPFGAPKFPRISRVRVAVPGGTARVWNNLDETDNPLAIAARDKYVQFLNSRRKKVNQRMMQGIRGFAGTYMLGGLSNLGSGQTWEDAPVSKGIGAVAGAASSGMMAGGAAAMMGFGPLGIAAVAAVPVVQELSEAIGEF